MAVVAQLKELSFRLLLLRRLVELRAALLGLILINIFIDKLLVLVLQLFQLPPVFFLHVVDFLDEVFKLVLIFLTLSDEDLIVDSQFLNSVLQSCRFYLGLLLRLLFVSCVFSSFLSSVRLRCG